MKNIVNVSELEKNDIIILENEYNRVDKIVKTSLKPVKLFTTLLKKENTIDAYNYEDGGFGKLKALLKVFNLT